MDANIPLIPPQNYEVIRDKIAEILYTELTEQAVLDDTFTAPQRIDIERFFAFDKTELPAINICYYTGDYSNKNQLRVDGDYSFWIDCYTNSATVGTDRGDKLAQKKLLQLLGKCRAILENPYYKTLTIAPGYIKRLGVKTMRIVYKEQDPTALNDIVGRIIFDVVAVEGVQIPEPLTLDVEGCTAKLYETAQGYYFGTPIE
jgi:hypothetical protein